MGAADQVEIVLVEELLDNLAAEGEGNAAVVLAPQLGVLVGVSPHQIAQQACVT